MGYWFTFNRSKQRSMVEESSICVPRRQADWSSCAQDGSRRPIDYDPASLLDLYFEQLMIDFGCEKEDLKGSFFKGCHGKEGRRFTRVNVGKNSLGYFGVEIASELLLPFPETFTGHCWRRSAGTNASNAGVNVTTLMSMMGWSCPKTAMEYVKRSRITSLQMSMYLTNVQRQNCSIPFPSNASDRRRKTVFPSLKSSLSKFEKKKDFFFSQEEVDEEDEVLSEVSDLLGDIGHVPVGEITNSVDTSSAIDKSVDTSSAIDKSVKTSSDSLNCSAATVNVVDIVSNVSVVNSGRDQVISSENVLSDVEPRLSNILQNLQNHGNLHIHFHFDHK
jgi:hypothetical protein